MAKGNVKVQIKEQPETTHDAPEAKAEDMDLEDTTTAGPSSTGAPTPRGKCKAKEYPCAECGVMLPHIKMIKSFRIQHCTVSAAVLFKDDRRKKDDAGQTRFKPERSDIKNFKKVCPVCELKLRLKEKEDDKEGKLSADYATEQGVANDLRKASHSEASRTRGIFYTQAIQEISEENKDVKMTKKERAAKTTERMKQQAKHFLKLLTESDMWAAMSKAGQRIRDASLVFERLEKLEALAEKEKDPIKKSLLNTDHAKELEKFEAAHFYETFAEHVDQENMIKALDYEDRVIPGKFNLFYCCRAKCGYEDCGYYFPGKFWRSGNPWKNSPGSNA
jgi:hypothetical protein